MELYSPTQPVQPTPVEPSSGEQRYRSLGRSVTALAALVALLYFGRDFFVTLIISAVFAFILDPIVVLVMKLRLPRPAATGIVIGIAFVAIYLVGVLAWSQAQTIADELPAYATRIGDVWGKANGALDQMEQQTIDVLVPKTLRDQSQQIQQKPQEALKARRRRANPAPTPAAPAVIAPPLVQEVRIHSDPTPVLTTLYSYTAGYLHVLVMAGFVPFLVYFMLSWRDHINKSVLRLFQGKQRYIVGKTWSGIGDSTRAYVLGNFLLWGFLSALSCIAFFALGVPYWAIVGPLSAFCSLVPYVGLPLAMIPPLAAALAIPNRFKIILTLLLITAALHVITMNFIYAKVVGRRVRLNPLVVTVAMMFFGLVWGGVGLVLAVPVTAALKTVCDNVESLEPYGKLLGD